MFNKKLFAYLKLVPIVTMLSIFFVIPSVQATPLTCNMSVVSGDDDGSFQMDLPFSLQLGNTNYNQVYYSTNGLMSFGQPDGNFWSYPSTPSVTLAGRDWVSWGPGAYTSYGYNESSFCIEWSVRPFPQSSGDLTQIRLVVNRFANGGWHGEITTLGWIPPDIRRGIVWEQGGAVLPIEAAFDVNGGVPVEVSPAPQPTSLTEPPAIPTQCWDGSTVYAPSTCPSEPSYNCWNGSTTHYSSECPTEPVVICWDNSQVHYQSECSPTPPDITCWNGEVVPWNGTCQQVPPPIDCWDGSSVNWDQQCPDEPIIYPSDSIKMTVDEGWQLGYNTPDGMRIKEILFASYGTPDNYQYSWCHANNSMEQVTQRVNNNILIVDANNAVFGDPCGGTYKRLSVVLTLEVDPNWMPNPEPTNTPEPTPAPTDTTTPEPSPSTSQSEQTPTPEPTVEPSPSLTPTPTPSPTQTVPVVPVVTPSPTPEPTVSSPLEATPEPSQSPSPDPIPADIPSINDSTEERVDYILNNLEPGEAVSAGMIEELGIDYEDLPPLTPVELPNGVILTAEVADALQMFENPDELLAAVITDPGKALKALANIGEDMTPQERDQSKKVVIAAVVAAQLMNGLSVANNIGRKL